jgi:hypothetical protein
MFIYEPDGGRTPEQGHQAQCLAAAMISAIQNFRDSIIGDQQRLDYADRKSYDAEATVSAFMSLAQSNAFLTEAEEYLRSGLQDCRCSKPEQHLTADDLDYNASQRGR